MTRQAFALVTAMSPGLLVVGFVETARMRPGELRKNVAFALMAGVLLAIGWLNANEPRRNWAARLLAFALTCATWHIFLAKAFYPGLMKQEDLSVATVTRLLGAYVVVVGGAFAGARLARWALHAVHWRLTA